MTVRDIRLHLAATIGVKVGAGTIPTITDAMCETRLEVAAPPPEKRSTQRSTRGAICATIRCDHKGAGENRAAHLAVGVDMEGVTHVLGIWVQADEGGRLWGPRIRRASEPGRARSPDSVLRRIDRLTSSHRSDLAPVHGPNLRCSLNPSVHAFRVLQGPTGHRSRSQGGVYTVPNEETPAKP